MKTKTMGMGFSIVLAALALFGADARAADKSPEVAALHAVDAAWLKAYTAADADAISMLYDANAILMPPGAPSPHGRAAIRAFFAKDTVDTKNAGLVFELDAHPDGGVSGNMGWVSGNYTVKDKSGKVVDTGKYLSVSKKEGGKWLYVRDTWNSDGAPAADATSK